jgi:hypothetical protein
LLEQDYLAPLDGQTSGEWKDIDWKGTHAYAIGLNSLYLNRAGREKQGQVPPEESEGLLSEITNRLMSWTGPDGQRVVQEVWRNEAAFHGSLATEGPDLVIGYTPGYRASAQTGLGGWESPVLESNGDHWSADHCIHPQAVPGVIFSSRDLANYPTPTYYDIPSLTLGAALRGELPRPPHSGSTPLTEDEEKIIQERLKSLGYF